MFISDSHMPQVLSATDYYSPEQHERELSQLLLPGWHLVGTLAELANDGDYLTQDLLGHPLIVWKIDGDVHAFLNVCPHRACMLTHADHGSMPRLKCQYHGWEFDGTGNTRKIPDAKSFRPMESGIVGLHRFRTETVGQLIFVTLNDEAPSLAEYLGPAYELCKEIADDTWQSNGVSDRLMDANWKIYIENTIETYHVETVHPTTIREIPAEETCVHEFDDRWSLLKTSGKDGHLDFLDRIAHRVLGVKRDPDYWNMLIYPNLVIGKMSLFSWVDETLPMGPDKMRIVARGFLKIGKRGVLPAIMASLVRRWGRGFFTRLVAEDAAVLPSVQQGLRSPLQPPGGLISIREERVFHFQKYVQEHTAQITKTESPGEPTHKLTRQ